MRRLGVGLRGIPYMTVRGTYKGILGARGFAVSEQLGNSYDSFS